MHIHNVLDVVAFALVGSTIIKGLCDYAGTYLVNYAGFGMITDLRNHLYEVIAAPLVELLPSSTPPAPFSPRSSMMWIACRRRSARCSAIFCSSSSPSSLTVALVIVLGGRLSWALLLFVPVVITSARRIGRDVRTRTRTGQDKLAEIQNILHETVTGNRIVKAFNTEIWEILRFKSAAKRLFRANLRSVRIQSISSPLMDTIGAIAIALFLWIGRNEIQHGRMTHEAFRHFHHRCSSSSTIRCASLLTFYNSFQQAMGASASIFGFLRCKGRCERTAARRTP